MQDPRPDRPVMQMPRPAHDRALRRAVHARSALVMSNRPGMLAGSLAVLLILSLSRWGSTIGLGSLYLTDMLLAAAVVHAALTFRSTHGAGSFSSARTVTMPPVFVLLLAFVIVRAALALSNGPLLDWVRDAVPYFYGAIAIISATAYVSATPERRRRTAAVLTVGLVFHLIWTAVVQLTPLKDTFVYVPFVGAPIFNPRPDIEAALNSVLAGVCVRAIILHSRYRFPAALGLVLAGVVILAQGTRAGTLALIACLVMSFTLTYAGLGRLDGRRVVMTLAAPAILIVAVITLPLTPPGQRIVATLFPDSITSATEGQQNAEGTANARRLVWGGVIDWTASSTPRLFLGSGFGNDFLTQSQTLQYLEGTDYNNVRSPHDYWIGSFARIGLVGLGLLLGTVLLALITVVRWRTAVAGEPTAFICALILVAIVPVASLGVVLEAPFGAVPFFWAVGVVFALRHTAAADT